MKFSERENAGFIAYLPCSFHYEVWQFPSCYKPLFQSEAKCVAIVETRFYKKCSHLARFNSESFSNLRTLCCVFSYWRLDRHLYSALSPEPPKCRAVILRPWLLPSPPPPGIKAATSHPAVKCSFNWTGPAAVTNRFLKSGIISRHS